MLALFTDSNDNVLPTREDSQSESVPSVACPRCPRSPLLLRSIDDQHSYANENAQLYKPLLNSLQNGYFGKWKFSFVLGTKLTQNLKAFSTNCVPRQNQQISFYIGFV